MTMWLLLFPQNLQQTKMILTAKAISSLFISLLLCLDTVVGRSTTSYSSLSYQLTGNKRSIIDDNSNNHQLRHRHCSVFRNEPLHAVMDRVCEMCHEMFSHEKPNLRAECRANCFRTDKFQSCLELFSPSTDQPIATSTDNEQRRRQQIFRRR